MAYKKYRGERRRKSKSLSSSDHLPSRTIAVLNSKFYIRRTFVDEFNMVNKHMGFCQDEYTKNWYFYLSYNSDDIELTVYRFAYYFFYQTLASKLRSQFRQSNNFFIQLSDDHLIRDRMILFPFKLIGDYPTDLKKVNSHHPITKNSSLRRLEAFKPILCYSNYYDLVTSPEMIFSHTR